MKRCEALEEEELKTLCEFVRAAWPRVTLHVLALSCDSVCWLSGAQVKEILVEESNVQPVNSPVTVCGDIHGQVHDLLKLFDTGGDVPSTNYIFMARPPRDGAFAASRHLRSRRTRVADALPSTPCLPCRATLLTGDTTAWKRSRCCSS